MSTPSASPPLHAPALGPATRLGAAHLTVTDLARSVAFYERALGLRVHRRDAAGAALGTGGEDVLVLVEDPHARPAGRHAGIYHVALLFATREELAHAALRLATTRTPIEGASDHGTHEAVYLPDPDGIGLELAADRPRDRWPDLSGPDAYAGGPQPLDLQDLLAAAGTRTPRPHAAPGLAVGHVHLHVPALQDELRFHRDVIGFDVVTTLPSAVFVSAGGYHHHLAFNLWRGEGIPAAPASGAVGLRHWTVVVDGAELAGVRARAQAAGIVPAEIPDGLALRDPAGIAIHVVAA